MGSRYDQYSREDLVRLLTILELGEAAKGGLQIEAAEGERYHNLMEQAADGIFIADANGVYCEVNEAGARMLGMERSEVIGRHIREVVIPEELPRIGPALAELQAGKVIVSEWWFKRKDGSVFPGEVSGKLLSDGRLQGILRDITARKHAEEALRQSEERYRNFIALSAEGIIRVDFAQPISTAWSPDDQAKAIQEHGFVAECNDAAARMRGWSNAKEIIGKRVAETMDVSDPTNLARLQRFVELNYRTTETTTHGRDAAGRDVFFLNNAIGVIREGVLRHIWTVQRDITERVRAEQALRESEERFHSLAASAFEGIGITDAGRVVDLNDQMAEMLGYTREELIGRQVRDLVAPESVPLVEQMIRSAAEGPYEHLAIRKDGTTIPVEVRAKAFPLAGRRLRVTSIRDIAERKRAEAALRSSEESLRATIENTPYVAVQWFDAQGRVVFWNHASEVMFGWNADEARGKTLEQLIHTPEEAAGFVQLLAEINRTGKAVGPAEYHFRHRNGSEGICLSTSFRISSGAGQSCFVCMDVDITEQKRSERALRVSEERFQLAVLGSNDGLWDWDVRTNEVYHSPRLRELLGYESPAEFPPKLDAFLAHLHPDDHARTWAAIQEHLTRRTPYDIEYRLCTRAGNYRWFRARGQAVWNEAGQAVRMAGSITDIHDHKTAEESLRKAQERELRAREEFAQHLLTAQELERQRLANELHDSLGQNLSLIKNRAHLALKQSGLPAAASDHLEAITRVISEAIAEVRSLAQNLRPLHIEQFGLTDSLDGLIEQMAQSTSIRIDHRMENVDDLFTGGTATHVYRMVQEALNNLIKHSQATCAKVVLERDVRCVRLRVEDDGCGFELRRAISQGGLGLTSISERARMLGGAVDIQSGPGEGTRLTIELRIAEGAGVPSAVR